MTLDHSLLLTIGLRLSLWRSRQNHVEIPDEKVLLGVQSELVEGYSGTSTGHLCTLISVNEST